MVRAKLTQKRYYESGSEEDSEDEVASRPPAKKKANQKVSQPRKIIYKDDVSESESEPEEEDDDSDFGAKKTPKKSPKKKAATPKKGKKVVSKKKTPAKATPKKGKGSAKKPIKPTLNKKKAAKNGHSSGRSSGRQKIRKSYADDSDESPSEDESQSEEESEEESESEEEVYVKPKKGSKKSAKKPPKKIKKVKKPTHPPVGEMFVTAIKRLKDHPRKGSSMAAIKGFMAEEWGLVIPDYAKKIKKFVLEAVEDGEVIQTKGKGLSGRFTVKGLKPKKRKKNPLPKSLDEDEVDYVPKKTARDEAKAKTEEELEAQRQQRMEEAVRKELEKANKPKRPVAPKKTEWEVEMIKAMKVTEDETYYKVKWFGSSKMTWEPEENLRGCQDAIDNFLIEEKSRIREEEARKKKLEEDGEYEVSRIMDVQILDGGAREFLVRWKYCTPKDDTWEPEDNLEGNEEMIEKFMAKHDQTHGEHISEKALRVAPKKVEKLNYKDLAGKKQRNKQGAQAKWNGTRMTYYGMDSDGSDY